MRRFLVACACGFSMFLASASYAAPVQSLVRLQNLNSSQISQLANEGYDIPKTGKDFAEIILEGPQIQSFVMKGYKLKVLVRNLDDYIKTVKIAQTKTDSYYNFASMQSQLKKWEETSPDICKLESIGKSHEGRDIWALKISDNPQVNEAEPAALLMGAHHAREWPSIEVPMATALKLIEEYRTNEEVKRLVDSREIWIVPMVNPDGVTYSMEKSRFWRKNRRNNGSSYGVDLNRNYGYQWGNVGSSNSGSSDTYHGTGPFSEPESQAIRNFVEREKFQASISYHTYSELILYPFGYAYNVPNPDSKIFEKMAGDMSKFNGYTPQNSAELYPAMGDSDDYLYGEKKVLSFTFELCRTFIPDASQIDGFTKTNVPAAIYLIDKAGTYGLVTPSARDELFAALDFEGSRRALVDAVDLFGRENNIAMRNEALKQLEKISRRAAAIVCEDLKEENLDSWKDLSSLPQAELAISFVRNRVLFEGAHKTGVYSPEVLSVIKNID